MAVKETNIFYPKSQSEWRDWLLENHEKEDAVRVKYYKKHTNKPSLTWSEAVDEALCFGWIDSKKKSIDESSYIQYFSKRKPKSIWSKINKEKISQLIKEQLMAEAGLKVVEIAKQNGSWTMFDDVENLIVPKDLELAFNSKPGSKAYYKSQSKSVQKGFLAWIVMAKREETRAKRIAEIVECASQGEKPKHFRV